MSFLIFLLTLIELNGFAKEKPKNVFGQTLQSIDSRQVSGFYRDGYCRAGADDTGNHVVAATVSKEFLDFSKSKGNDLMTPHSSSGFAGLKPGDKWCLCADRWKEAFEAGVAPPINLKATDEKALKFIPLETLKKFMVE